MSCFNPLAPKWLEANVHNDETTILGFNDHAGNDRTYAREQDWDDAAQARQKRDERMSELNSAGHGMYI